MTAFLFLILTNEEIKIVNANSLYNFINSIQEKYMLLHALTNFIKYLGFETFKTTGPTKGLGSNPSDEILTTEVYGFDDRRIFLSVLNESGTLRGKYVITDKNRTVLDIITFKADGFDWIEEDEK